MQGPVAMSEHKRLSMRDNKAVSLASGTADLFLVGSDAQLWPLIAVTGPIDLVGPDDGPIDMVAVARVGAKLTVLDDRGAQLEKWCLALGERFGADLGDLQPSDEAAVRSRLKSFSSAHVLACEQRGTTEQEGTAAQDRRLVEWTKSFLTASVNHAGVVNLDPDHLTDPDLVLTFRILGQVQGFDVVNPNLNQSNEVEAVRAIAVASAVRTRKVSLSDGWNERTETHLLGFITSAEGSIMQPVALLPSRSGYRIQRPGDLRPKPIADEEIAALAPVAYQVYVPLPHSRPATVKDIVKLAVKGTMSLWLLVFGCAAASAILALATPVVSKTVLGVFVPAGSSSAIVLVGVVLCVLAITAAALVLVQALATSKLAQVAQLRVTSAIWDRTLNLPLRFFREYQSGDLATRVQTINDLADKLNSQVVTVVLAAVFSLVNFALLFSYSLPLAIAAAILIGITGFVIVRLVFRQTAFTRQRYKAQRESVSWLVQLITGLSKVRVAGAEDRFTALTMNIYAQDIGRMSQSTLMTGGRRAYFAGLSALAPIVFFVIVGTLMWSSNGATIDPSTYIAFSIAFGTVLGATTSLVYAAPALGMIKPALELIGPFLESTQTQSVDAKPLGQIAGKIELKDLSFRYQPSTPEVLKGISLVINPGEMTAIVGPSGSGKTSILRMITGVESPDSGEVLIDGHDLRDIDGNDYRRRIGTVIQGGQVLAGSVLDNISGGAEISEDAAWRAADAASIGDEIRAMPMKLNSVVSTSTFSGGQAQRILIARALARDPKILLFDEATSALDNESQDVVMESVSKLDLTRVVIAHRLSTVMNADRILLIADGRLAEEGTYRSLMERDGLFAELAKRQLS